MRLRIRLFGGSIACVWFLAGLSPVHADNDYKLGPDSQVQPGVPQGEVTHYTWKSKIFPGTERSYWVYVPGEYDPAKPACVMIFQDGGGFQDTNGQFRVPVVFDNLIHKQEMPVTIAILIDPGVVPAASGQLPRFNRSYEYDAPTDQYARFLLEEILPEVGKHYNLTQQANGRALCGASSGGICAFTAAWQRPDQFSRVISFIGSFTDLRGGNGYPPLIRKSEPKPLRIFLQDGTHDQDIYSGSWFLGNSDVAAALKFAGYDTQFVTGDGGHDGRQGGSILPDALRWLWRDYPAPIHTPPSTPQPVMEVLLPDQGWQAVESGVKAADNLTADATGTLFFSSEKGICRLDPEGKAEVVHPGAEPVTGLAFGPDGSLYASLPKRKGIFRFDTAGQESQVVKSMLAGRLAIDHKGDLYFVDRGFDRIWRLESKSLRVLSGAPYGVNALQFTPDQSLLLTSQTPPGKYISSFHIEPDDTVTDGQPFFDLEIPYGNAESGVRAMTMETQGRLYVATEAGIQICDQAGRVIGVLSNAGRTPATSLAFGGAGLDTLYVTAGGTIYKRRTKARGVLSFQNPVLPPAPRL